MTIHSRPGAEWMGTFARRQPETFAATEEEAVLRAQAQQPAAPVSSSDPLSVTSTEMRRLIARAAEAEQRAPLRRDHEDSDPQPAADIPEASPRWSPAGLFVWQLGQRAEQRARLEHSRAHADRRRDHLEQKLRRQLGRAGGLQTKIRRLEVALMAKPPVRYRKQIVRETRVVRRMPAARALTDLQLRRVLVEVLVRLLSRPGCDTAAVVDTVAREMLETWGRK